MTTFPLEGRGQLRFGLLLALLVAGFTTPARAAVIMQDAADDETTVEARSAGRWEALAVSSARSAVADETGALTITLAAGDRASFSRAANLSAPAAILLTFNVSTAKVGEPVSQVFRLGWDFGTSNGDESDVTTYARIGLSAQAAGGFQLRDLVGGTASPVFSGTQAVTWALNNGDRALNYLAPNGTVQSIGVDRMDLYIGRQLVFDDVLVTQPEGRITDLKWYWGRGSGVTHFDHFEIRTLEESTGPAAVKVPTAELASIPTATEAKVVLDRPTPNPFGKSMKFAYSIPSGSAAVDIGIFDVAGRRVRELARGTQSVGQYEVRWDGLGDDGGRVRGGVYFLRASVGGASRVSRVVYLPE